MAFRVNGVDIQFQGLNLNCGRYCLEALMRWKHGTKFGAQVNTAPAYNASGIQTAVYGAPRTAHDAAVQKHIDTRLKIGFDPADHAAAYGLILLPKSATAMHWESKLRTYGPLIVSGHIGAVRIIPADEAGHFVLVIGITSHDEIEYLDPLRPLNAFNKAIPSMSVKKFGQLARNTIIAAAV